MGLVSLHPPEKWVLAALFAGPLVVPIWITLEIAERARGNGRAAMADLEMWLG